jgi:hypothetical protein
MSDVRCWWAYFFLICTKQTYNSVFWWGFFLGGTYFIFTFKFFIVLRVHGDIYKSSYNISNIILEFTPSIILLYSVSPIPGIVSNSLIFPFIYMCTQWIYFHYIHPPTLFPHILPPLTGINPWQDLFCPSDLWFCKRKKLTFLFV